MPLCTKVEVSGVYYLWMFGIPHLSQNYPCSVFTGVCLICMWGLFLFFSNRYKYGLIAQKCMAALLISHFRRGLIMGVWNSHTSVGNILGSLIAGLWVNTAWGWSFVVPGIIIAGLGVLVFLFLVPGMLLLIIVHGGKETVSNTVFY